MDITHGELFAGIGGFGLGADLAGMKTIWHVEIDKHAQSVLKKHWPDTQLEADVTQVGAHNLPPVDVLSFGSPCQDLSVAGKRKGMKDGTRSNLFFEAVRIIRELDTPIAIWENVPGALSRRRRIILIADFRGQRSAQILFESYRGSGNYPQINEEREGTTEAFTVRTGKSGGGNQYVNENKLIVMAHGQANAEILEDKSPTLSLNHEAPILVSDFAQIASKQHGSKPSEISQPLNTLGQMTVWQNKQSAGEIRVQDDISPTMTKTWGTGGNNVPFVGVRRLTPTECERLQGFPDGWTDGQSDSQRYKQLGNAVAVPVANWVMKRIMEEIHAE